MFKLNNKSEEIFTSDMGRSIYERMLNTVNKHHMDRLLDGGVLLGFSGGADSVMLLLFLLEYQRQEAKTFPILCVHVNHGIRGVEADRDEAFSLAFVNESSAEFKSIKVDLPSIAKERGLGIEEAARNIRYSIFDEIITSRNDISCIAVAHNATDNIETVMFNMLRGTGLAGVSGIKPVRDNIVRPLISISKSEILDLLNTFHVEYVVDSTNLSTEYTRNFIRNKILPLFNYITKNPEASVARMTENLFEDLRFIDESAEKFISENFHQGSVSSEKLSDLPHSLFARVISKIIHTNTGIYPEEKHINALRKLIRDDNFSFSLPGDFNLCSQRGKCFFINKNSKNPIDSMIFPLTFGENIIEGTNLVVYIGEIDKSSLNVYNFSIQAMISSDIIDKGLLLRTKKDGDSYKYAGVTHKLKKVFNDRNIPPVERQYIPVIADNEGILWVPGLSVREGSTSGKTANIPIYVCYKQPSDKEVQMYTALKRM